MCEESGRKSTLVWGCVPEIRAHSIRSKRLGARACLHTGIPAIFFYHGPEEKCSTHPENCGNAR